MMMIEKYRSQVINWKEGGDSVALKPLNISSKFAATKQGNAKQPQGSMTSAFA